MISGFTLAPLFGALVYFGGVMFYSVVGLVGCVALYELYSLARRTDNTFLWLVLGAIYIGGSFYSFYILHQTYSIHLTFLFVFVVWFSDCGAYLMGKIIGGPKMAKVISPNKTWAGLCGATVFPGLLFALWAHYMAMLDSVVLGFVIGVGLGVVGQMGDLLVSFLKRQAQVKDSGVLIPGHGGVLDRIDAMLLVMPIYFLIIKFYLVG